MRYSQLHQKSFDLLKKVIRSFIDSADSKNRFFHTTNYFTSESLFTKNVVVQNHCSFYHRVLNRLLPSGLESIHSSEAEGEKGDEVNSSVS